MKTGERCDACGGSAFFVVYQHCLDRRHWLPGAFDIHRCRACGAARTWPRLKRAELAMYYPREYASFVHHSQIRSPILRALRDVSRSVLRLRYRTHIRAASPSPSGGRLLDIGSGTGEYLQMMSDRGWNVWGIEPDADAIRKARERHGLSERIFHGPVETARFPPESFDVVTMNHVLEHLHDPASVLSSVASWLTNDGELHLRVPNFDSAERKVSGQFWFGLDVPRHLNHFSPRGVRTLLGRCGFTVEVLTPEFQTASLTGTVRLVADAVLRRRRAYEHSPALYYTLMPIGLLLIALGSMPTMEIVARRTRMCVATASQPT